MLVLENGSGVQGANSAINSDFVTSYLTTLNRQDQNGWNSDATTDAIRQAACIAATQYVEKRWGDRFIGEKLYFWEEVKATAQIQINGVAHRPYSPFKPEQPFVPAMNEINCPVVINRNFVEALNGVDKCYDIDIPTLCPDFTMGTALFAGTLVFINDSDQTGITYSLRYTNPEQGEADIIPQTTAEGMTQVVLAGVLIEPRSITLCANADGASFDDGDEIDANFSGSVSRDATEEIPFSAEEPEVDAIIGSDQYIEISGKKISFSDDALNPTAEAVNLLMKLKANEITAELDKTDNTTVIVTSSSYGVMGNYDMPITQGNHAGLAPDEEIPLNITQWAGGLHGGEQQTSYPREDWSEPMPLIYLNALAEYAIRSLADGLIPDPEVDPSGRVVIEKKERVGAIEEQTKYAVGTSLTQQFKPYPEADILLRPLLRGGQGRVYR